MAAAPLVAAVFLVMGLVRLAPSLTWPMVYDDLHLVRTYTPAELRGAWLGNWDPDGVETPGFRPLSVLFNHARAAVLGEDVAAHRVVVMVLYACYVWLLVPLARRLGTGPGTVLVAGTLLLASRHGTYHYVWITDGNHVLQGLAFAASALLLLSSLVPARAGRLLLSLACLGAGLLVREDTLAVVPVLLLLGCRAVRGQDAGARRALGAYAAGVVALVAVFWTCRSVAVPDAQHPGADLRSLAVAVTHVMNPVGTEWWDPLSRALSLGGWVVLLGLVAALARWRREVDWRGPGLWMSCAVLACTPALTLQRDDLLFFPGTFVALFYASAVVAVARRGLTARVLAGGAMAVLVAGATWVGLVFAENFHPDSTRALWWNMQMVYGEFAPRATIPPARRQAVRERLARAGIREGGQPRQHVRELSAAAKAAGRRRPAPDGSVFLPWLPEGF
jgi:hypothetical protein